MSWWRRDPSPWCRSPIHRYSRRLLGDSDVALRSRCFSKLQPYSAQHKDDEDRSHAHKLLNRERIQLQQYRIWLRRLEEEPYDTLFGPSNDMLRGKGLKNWSWIYDKFPKRVLQEMGFTEEQGPAKAAGKGDVEGKPKTRASTLNSSELFKDQIYPRKVNLSSENSVGTGQTTSKDPSIKPPWFDVSDLNGGIASPSDSRRPREDTEIRRPPSNATDKAKPGGNPNEQGHLMPLTEWSSQEIRSVPKPYVDVVRQDETEQIFSKQTIQRPSLTVNDAGTSGSVLLKGEEKNGWQPLQTALDRREVAYGYKDARTLNVHDLELQPQIQPEETIGEAEKTSDRTPGVDPTQTASFKDHRSMVNDATSRTRSSRQAVHETSDNRLPSHMMRSKSTSDILQQLPEEDIDFLSANDIRASMRKKIALSNTSENEKTRSELEKSFENAHKMHRELEPLHTSILINNQHMRKTERHLSARQSQETVNTKRAQPRGAVSSPAQENLLETSLERMTKWLQAGGTAFARQLWTDPVHEHEEPPIQRPSSRDPQLRNLIAGLKTSRETMKQVKEECQNDLPSAKQLFDRLQACESSAIMAITRALRSKLDPNIDCSRATHQDRSQKLRNDLSSTQKELDDALSAVSNLHEGANHPVSPATTQRLNNASSVIQKNVTLARKMVMCLQIRLDGGNDDKMSSLDRDILHRLLTLYDTQLALLRLVEYPLRLSTVSSNTNEAGLQNQEVTVAIFPSTSTECAISNKKDSASTNNAAADKKLDDEIQAQKKAMQGLSDDGYTRQFKSTHRASLDEPKPLAHSLFRPFGLQIENLGKHEDTQIQASSTGHIGAGIEKKMQQLEDRRLVRKLREAYEDTYGPITIHHRQVEGNSELTIKAEDNAKATEQEVRKAPTTNMMECTSASGMMRRKTSTAADAATAQSQLTTQNQVCTQSRSEALNNDDQTPSEAIARTANAFSAMEPVSTIDPRGTTTFDSLSKEFARTTTAAENISESNNTVLVTERSTYVTYAYDPANEELVCIGTHNCRPSNLVKPIPLHEALAIFEVPARFLAHMSLPTTFEITFVKQHLLVIRDSDDAAEQFDWTKTVEKDEPIREAESIRSNEIDERSQINPIDGTTRLSPTGFAGVAVDDLREEVREEMTKLQTRKDAEKRAVDKASMRSDFKQRNRKEKTGRVAGVLKTAIVASAVCYMVGVIGELYR